MTPAAKPAPARPLLQVALDFLSLEEALAMAEKAAPHVDILEAGTPLIKSEGIRAVQALRKAYPDHLVCADIKTADAGYLEVELAALAGADIITVLADAYDETIQEALRAARKFRVEILVDLIMSRLPVSRLADVMGIQYQGSKVHYACVHSGLDRQAARRAPLSELESVNRLRDRPKLAVAGGLRLRDFPSILTYPLSIVIVGGGITRAKDPTKAAKSLQKALQKARPK